MNEITENILANMDFTKLKGLIFDCDGTLMNSEITHDKVWENILHDNGVKNGINLVREMHGTPDRSIIAYLNSTLNLTLDSEKISSEKLDKVLQQIHEIREITAVSDIARQYYQNLPMAVVSGGEREVVEACLQHHSLISLFDIIICADTPTKPKPSADIFLYAAKMLNIEPTQCHVFEDADFGIRGAIDAGMSYTDVRRHLPQ